MRRIIQYSLACLFLIILGSAVAGFVYLRRLYSYNEEVSPVRLDRTLESYCTEPPTTNDFQEFLREFRHAVNTEDKDKLFSLIRKCNFVWAVQPSLRLSDASCILGPVDDCHYAIQFGGSQIFLNRREFDETYNQIFTKTNRDRMLNGTPWETAYGYAVSWETDYGTNSLKLELVSGVGYKFSGLDWEPIPLEMLKVFAAKGRE